MFKLVDPVLSSDLTALLSPSVVDIQLVGDGLADDPTFTWDKSVRKGATRPVYTYVSLCDVLPPEEMAEIRDVVFRVLSGLATDVTYLCFMTGGRVPESDVGELENHLIVRACHESLRMNGRLVVAEMNRDDLAYSMQYFGHYDTMRGVALRPEGLRGMVADLRLFEPVPTTDRGQRFQPPRYGALAIALKHGVFFFEEVNNGTRLRIVSTAISQADLTLEIAEILRETSRRSHHGG
jgi:hypothetical protein